MSKNVLLVYGGDGHEHEISIRSKNFILEQLKQIDGLRVYSIEIKNKKWIYESDEVYLRSDGKIVGTSSKVVAAIDFVVPCLHGFPGETGELPGFLEMIDLPFLGNTAEKCSLCFNKITTKLWLEKMGIPTTPFLFFNSPNEVSSDKLDNFWSEHLNLFVKASSEGSSVGCYPVTKKNELSSAIEKAFQFSDQVLVEKFVYGRELEVACYEFGGEVIATHPGEIICSQDFYSYDEKYSSKSQARTEINALNLSEELVQQISDYSLRAFRGLGLRHLSRVDFLLDKEGDLYINEINTFPGMTNISLFPLMLESNGHKFSDYLAKIINQ